MINLASDVRPTNANGEDLFKNVNFIVNQDVNASAYVSDETKLINKSEVAYGLSGTGAFTLTIKWTDGLGTVLYSETVSSADGSAISGAIPVRSNHLIIEVSDDSVSANTVTGTINAH